MSRESIGDVIHNIIKRQEKISKEIGSLTCKRETISVEELQKISEIKKALNKFTDEFMKEMRSNKTLGFDELTKQHIDKIINYLDQLDIWVSKFSTGSDKKTMNSEEESIYYITSSNVSLRLKLANAGIGPENVIQPFMENIHFCRDRYDENEELSEKPVVGFCPVEFSSEEFQKLQKEESINDDFVSPIEKYYKGDKLQSVNQPQKYFHFGHAINKIFFDNHEN